MKIEFNTKDSEEVMTVYEMMLELAQRQTGGMIKILMPKAEKIDEDELKGL